MVVASLWRVGGQDPGFETDRNVVKLDPGRGSNVERLARLQAALDRVRAVPGVESVGLVGIPLFDGVRMSPGICRQRARGPTRNSFRPGDRPSSQSESDCCRADCRRRRNSCPAGALP
jgi:hypothetical protein